MIALILLVAYIVIQLVLLGAMGCRRDGVSPFTRQFWL